MEYDKDEDKPEDWRELLERLYDSFIQSMDDVSDAVEDLFDGLRERFDGFVNSCFG